MGRESRKVRYLSEIRSMSQLREVRGELEIREWFARERLMDDAVGVFSVGTLVSMLVPRGSVLGRVVGGMGSGFSAARAAVGSLWGRGEGCGCKREGHGREATHPASHHPAHASAHHAAPKRSPEIVVEVELDEPRVKKQ